MSTFAIFQKMNQKLEEGWKLTNQSCPTCNFSIIGRLDTQEMYCLKCDKTYVNPKEEKVEKEEEEDQNDVEVIGSEGKTSPKEEDNIISKEEENILKKEEVISREGEPTPDEEDDFDNMVIQRQREIQREKSDELSKKMSEKLLQGWAMLEESCFNCMFPYMRSRKGEVICVGCGPVQAKQEEEKVFETVKAADLQEVLSPTTAPVEQPKKSHLPPQEEQTEPPMESQEPTEEKEEVPNEEKKEVPTKKDKEVSEKDEDNEKEESSEESSDEEVPKKKSFKKAYKEKEYKKKPFKKYSKPTNSGPVNIENVQKLFELGRFDESLSLYSKMTSLLSAELDKAAETGLEESSDTVWEVLCLQKKIDKSKAKIIKRLGESS